MFRGTILLSLCLAAGCTAMPAKTPEAEAARQSYDDCLRNNAAQFDQPQMNPGDAGVTLAGFCLQEFSHYRELSGVDESVNEATATRVIISRRHH